MVLHSVLVVWLFVSMSEIVFFFFLVDKAIIGTIPRRIGGTMKSMFFISQWAEPHAFVSSAVVTSYF